MIFRQRGNRAFLNHYFARELHVVESESSKADFDSSTLQCAELFERAHLDQRQFDLLSGLPKCADYLRQRAIKRLQPDTCELHEVDPG